MLRIIFDSKDALKNGRTSSSLNRLTKKYSTMVPIVTRETSRRVTATQMMMNETGHKDSRKFLRSGSFFCFAGRPVSPGTRRMNMQCPSATASAATGSIYRIKLPTGILVSSQPITTAPYVGAKLSGICRK